MGEQRGVSHCEHDWEVLDPESDLRRCRKCKALTATYKPPEIQGRRVRPYMADFDPSEAKPRNQPPATDDCEHEWQSWLNDPLAEIWWCVKCGSLKHSGPICPHPQVEQPSDRAAMLARIAELEGQVKGPGDWPLGHVWFVDPGVSRARYELRCKSVYGLDNVFWTNCPNLGARAVRELSHWAGCDVIAHDRRSPAFNPVAPVAQKSGDGSGDTEDEKSRQNRS